MSEISPHSYISTKGAIWRQLYNQTMSRNNSGNINFEFYQTISFIFSNFIVYSWSWSVYDCRGNVYTTRALLDSASQSNFMNESLTGKLNLPVHDSNIIISEITRTSSKLNKCTAVKIASRNYKYNSLLPCLILPRISDNFPQMSFNKNLLNIPSGLCLADPCFNISKPIELLIGSTVFWDLMEDGQIKLNILILMLGCKCQN